MPNTPASRPDVVGIEQNLTIVRREALRFPDEPFGLYQAIQIIERTLGLITYIKALEARQVKLEAVVEAARALDAMLAIPPSSGLGKALADLGEGNA